MADRIRTALPLLIILVIIGSLINIGAIPGKGPILRFLGLTRENQTESGRPLDYVPGRLLELAPPPGEEINYPTPTPGGIVSTPYASPRIYPSPQTYPTPRVYPSPTPISTEPPMPPPPPPEIFGAKTTNLDASLPSNKLTGEINNQSKSGSIFEALDPIMNFFSGIF
ncbi:hypothetical protein A2W70_02495 [Candidatus Curtissbacteria bacterium RIFCSPLOWO2_02_41_11]|uniref:Uncharacterized protein n=2 Tax=Candidatus Curtissiibacteriota TaxID=1752717 RepID=A0A1F5HU77_9BACT|nr:MAG: hypothetical protein UU56_C0015G0004 [Candidatus Curtissbacteria bacterium GW2011_GWA2_41_24]OGE07633.1 MAG: hypothetical protein A2W70_02495 [Candidatus Curtissbacteria bacterium RIFCSPLOWO2_02_41_11]